MFLFDIQIGYYCKILLPTYNDVYYIIQPQEINLPVTTEVLGITTTSTRAASSVEQTTTADATETRKTCRVYTSSTQV